MKPTTLWADDETFVLAQLDLFNWGGFHGRHQAAIDPAGTAVIGPTGSGKTTLVDALMTLLCANPRYNLASTGGHESDRDLASYVRGVSGPGDGGVDQSHIARPGKTVTAITATFENRERLVRLGGILWFEGTSSAASDMKKLWLFTEAPEHTLEHWLTLHQEGGMRALRQMEKQGTGIWTFPSKKHYLARLRDYFDVGENAFTLLNRAAGLKQLNSIDEIFRELVLDDHSAFDRAAEVANSFDDLRDIHEELEIARRQQRSLLPVAEGWEQYQRHRERLEEQETLRRTLPIWYAEQAHGLWKAEVTRLEQQQTKAQSQQDALQQQTEQSRKAAADAQQVYLQAGGGSIDELQARIDEWTQTRAKRARYAQDYRQLVSRLELPESLDAQTLSQNQTQVAEREASLHQAITEAQDQAFHLGTEERLLKTQLAELEQEHAEVSARPGSNLPAKFQRFRAELAEQLNQSEADLPFVAELVQVKATQSDWRGAIERAIGSQRLRILVPPDAMKAALQWVNSRHNKLHVRLLEVKQPDQPARFFEDGYTRKLEYKDHPYREAVKHLLAGIDRHCVDSVEQLRDTAHAMTVQGTLSGKARFFDKQDQKRLDEDWLTGFDNRDRLAALKAQIAQVRAECGKVSQNVESAKTKVSTLTGQAALLSRLKALEFDDIDLPGAERTLASLRERLEQLTSPDSDSAKAKQALEDAERLLRETEQQYHEAYALVRKLQDQHERATQERQKAYRRSEAGLTEEERALADATFTPLSESQREEARDLEAQAAKTLQAQIDKQRDKCNGLKETLIRRMSDALKEDRGALSEVGRELEDVPRYLERLQVLTEEALPEKLNRFLEYLNQSSDQGVIQLLSFVDNEVSIIEERIEDLNSTLRRVDFQPGRYLRLVSKKVIHESLRTLQRALRELTAARYNDDAGESQYKALQHLVNLLRDACERRRTQGAKALLDPRFRVEFAVSVMDRDTGQVIETRTGSQGGSGGEKEIIASYVLTASLSYALCPDGSARPLFGTIVLDEAFSRSSHAVAGRIIAALREFGLHAVFITPNKEMRLLRNHTRSAIVVHRRGMASSLTSLSWEALGEYHQQRIKAQHEVTE
jgi:uncharacterized protein YPO0396